MLPPLTKRFSPNQSERLHDITPYLIVVHRPVGSYASSVDWLCDPKSQASAHVVTDSNRGATQLVPWNRKAWACASFNSVSYNVEVDDNAWSRQDPEALQTAARIVAFLCHKTGIPPRRTTNPAKTSGVVRHYDLGVAGGGHTDPTTDGEVWVRFLLSVDREYSRGGFRESWGEGKLARIDT